MNESFDKKVASVTEAANGIGQRSIAGSVRRRALPPVLSQDTGYQGVGHDSWTQTYRNADVLDWLFKQKKP